MNLNFQIDLNLSEEISILEFIFRGLKITATSSVTNIDTSSY